MLDKRVPFGAGLGGGSSDATAVILAVDELCGLHLAEEEPVGCAAALGSDTAFSFATRRSSARGGAR